MNAQTERSTPMNSSEPASNDNISVPSEAAASTTTTSLTTLPVLTRVTTAGASPTSANVNGRVLPLVYLKMPQNQTVRVNPSSVVGTNAVLPIVSRSGNLIPALAPKISIAPTGNASVGLTGNQAAFVTIRSGAQTTVTSSPVASSQASFVTLPKTQTSTLSLSNQQLLALQNPSVTQALPGQQAQFVTIQAPIVSKSPATSGQTQQQFVTIRTPVLTSGNPSSTGTTASTTQGQYVTIQAPLIQAGQASSATFMPVSSVGTSATSGKAPITYQILKSNAKPGDQHIVYPVSNLLPANQSKVLLSSVSVMSKNSCVSSVTSAPPVVVSTMTDPVSNVVSILPPIKTNHTPSIPKASTGQGVSLLQSKNQQTQSLLKEPPHAVTSDTESSGNQASQAKVSSVLLPVGVSVSGSAATGTSTQGFINLTIANGHIQQSASRSADTPKENNASAIRSLSVTSETNGLFTSKVTTSKGGHDEKEALLISQNQTDGGDSESEVKSVNRNSIPVSKNVIISDSIRSHEDKENESENLSTKRKSVELNRCLQEAVEEIFSAKKESSGSVTEDQSDTRNVATPMSLFCDEDSITLTKLSPTDEEPKRKYTITMDHPDDDIKIELVKTMDQLEDDLKNKLLKNAFDSDSKFGSHDTSVTSADGSEDLNQLLNTPLSQKSSNIGAQTPPNKVTPKGLTTHKAGQSLMKSPVNMQSILMKPGSVKPTPKGRLSVKSSSILKPKQSLLKTDGSDSGPDSTQNSPKTAEGLKLLSLGGLGAASGTEDFDPIAALEWSNGIGLLPGSSLKFRMNEFGLVEMVSDDDAEHEKKADKPHSSPESFVMDEGSMASNSSVTSGEIKLSTDIKQKSKKEKLSANNTDDQKPASDDFYCCEVCGVYGLASEFLNSRFCTQVCSAAFTVKKAWQYKREQDLRALRLRRKKRRLEQQRMAREKAEQDEQLSGDKISKKGKHEVGYMSDDQMDSANLEDRLNQTGSQASKSSSTMQSSGTSGKATNGTPAPVLSDENNTGSEATDSAKKLGRPTNSAGSFTWCRYLEMVKGKAAPAKLFKDAYPYLKNSFKVGMKLEGIDPDHPAYFCVLSIVEVKGYRLRLHFDGYPDNYDFWVNADSPEIFQAGWCEKNLRRLTPPRGSTPATFNWNSYLKQSKSTAAPRLLFSKSSASPVCPNGFRLGMKLEAVDRKNSSLICVATVADILDNRILVHFDSWDEMYDYWADPSSAYIHPVGWCKEHGHTLTPPNQFKNPESFSWETYLKDTKSVAAPARAFKARPPCGFRRGMRIEAVDKRVPHLIRVATVDDIADHRIRIKFDGWPDIYSYWVDDDSPDIHPPGWCRETKHPLEPPLGEDDASNLAKCGILGCRGEGHIKGPKYATHNSAQNCPYAPENLSREGAIPDRLSIKSETGDGLDESPIKDTKRFGCGTPGERIVGKPLGRPPKWKRLIQGEDENVRKRRRVSDDGDEEGDKEKHSLITAMQQKLQMELERSVLDPGYQIETGPGRPACWAKHSVHLQSSPIISYCSNPLSWTPDEVAKFVSSVAGLEDNGQRFCDEDIDGEALLLLTQQELVSNLGLKLGPAIKLYNCIVLLRQKCS